MNDSEKYFLEQFDIAMQQMRYADLILSAKKIIVGSKNSEILNAYATLLDHQAVLESGWIKHAYLEWQARRLYQKNLRRDPNNIDALSGIGRIYWHKSSPKAIPYYKRALELDPINAVRMGNLANVYARIGQKEEAAILYRQAIATNHAPFGIYLNFLRNIQTNRQDREKFVRAAEEKIHALHVSETKKLALEQLEEIKNRIMNAD